MKRIINKPGAVWAWGDHGENPVPACCSAKWEPDRQVHQEVSFPWTQDPNSNRIAQWLEVVPEQGIVQLSFQLAPEATLGTYTVAVAEGKTFDTFSVEEYGRWENDELTVLGVIWLQNQQ